MNIRDESEVIKEIQKFILEISYQIEEIPHVVIDGFYESETIDAVRIFQRQEGLPVTGEVDRVTYERLYLAYTDAIKQKETP